MNKSINAILSYAVWCQDNFKHYFENIGSPYEPKTLAVQDLTIAEMCEGNPAMLDTIERYVKEIFAYKDIKQQYELLTDLAESVRHLSFWYADKVLHYVDGTTADNEHYSPELSKFCSEQYYRLKQMFYEHFTDNEEAKEYFFNIDD